MDQQWKNNDEQYNRKSSRYIGFSFSLSIYGRVSKTIEYVVYCINFPTHWLDGNSTARRLIVDVYECEWEKEIGAARIYFWNAEK